MSVAVRRATAEDVPAIARLLADDFLGVRRETLGPPLPDGYLAAFREIDADPNARLFVAQDGSTVVGTFQLSFLRRMSRAGHRVCEIESVHVAADQRGKGIGTRMMEVALAEARSAGCSRVQLTSDRQRTEAHRFYERLGFAQSHLGFKLTL